jgi:hypothetical protein
VIENIQGGYELLFKRLRARSSCVIFEMVAMAFLGGVGGLSSGGVGDMFLGAALGAAIGVFVGIVLVLRYAPEPEVQENLTGERLEVEPVVRIEV